MTRDASFQLHEAAASLGARLASTQLMLSQLDLVPYLNQARSVPWSGVAMVVASNLRVLVA